MHRAVILALLASTAGAHEMTPSHLTFQESFIQGLSKTSIDLFNKRQDTDYYEIEIYTEDWRPIRFVSEYDSIVQLKYLARKHIPIYVKYEDVARARYVCTTSKVIGTDSRQAIVTSKICSKVL